MKTRKPTRSRPSRPRARSRRRAAGTEPTGCRYEVEWKRLATTRGYVQVWVSRKTYDRVAADFMKLVGRDEKLRLRRRAAPLGVDIRCTGTCEGGWCNQVVEYPDELSIVYSCECSYFV